MSILTCLSTINASTNSSSYPAGLAYHNGYVYAAILKNNSLHLNRFLINTPGNTLTQDNDFSVSTPSTDHSGASGVSLAVHSNTLYATYRCNFGLDDDDEKNVSGGDDAYIYFHSLDLSNAYTGQAVSLDWSANLASGKTDPLIQNWKSMTPDYSDDSHNSSKYPASFSPLTDSSPRIVADGYGNIHLVAKSNSHTMAYGWYDGSQWNWNVNIIPDGMCDKDKEHYFNYSQAITIAHTSGTFDKKDLVRSERNPSLAYYNSTIYMAHKGNESTDSYAYPIYYSYQSSKGVWAGVADSRAFNAFDSEKISGDSKAYSNYQVKRDDDGNPVFSKANPGYLVSFDSNAKPTTSADAVADIWDTHSSNPIVQLTPALVSSFSRLRVIYIQIPSDDVDSGHQQGGTLHSADYTTGDNWVDNGDVSNNGTGTITVPSSCKEGPTVTADEIYNVVYVSYSDGSNAKICVVQIT